MSHSRRIRVLLVHRSTPAAAGLEVAFGRLQDFELTSAANRADVAVVDCETGLRLLSAGRPGRCRIVIFTDDESEASVRSAAEQGASGYLLMSSTSADVVRAARYACEGRTLFDPIVAGKLVSSLSDEPLTPRQTEVLKLLMRGLRNRTIAATLGCTLLTAKAHVKAVLEKLHVCSRAEAVAIARRRGLISEAQLYADTSPTRSPVQSGWPERAGRSLIRAWRGSGRADGSGAGLHNRSM